MAAGDVHGELTVAGEPFCGLPGMAFRQKNPFVLENVLSLSIHGLTLKYILYSCESAVRRVLFECTHTLNVLIYPTVVTYEVLLI